MKIVTITECKRRFSIYLNLAAHGEPVIITRHGKPVAILVKYELSPAHTRFETILNALEKACENSGKLIAQIVDAPDDPGWVAYKRLQRQVQKFHTRLLEMAGNPDDKDNFITIDTEFPDELLFNALGFALQRKQSLNEFIVQTLLEYIVQQT
jgi:prevent-host-death family protein